MEADMNVIITSSLGGEYYVAAEPPVRCGESHHSGQAAPPQRNIQLKFVQVELIEKECLQKN